jgi:DNA-binding NarL/FixJ family response regulator
VVPCGGGYACAMPLILIADDHPLFRRALAQTVVDQVPGTRVLEAGSLPEVRDTLAGNAEIDLVLLDLHMPGSQGLIGLAGLRAGFPTVAVVLVSAHEDPRTIRRALAMGALGFIPKRTEPAELAAALTCVLDCKTWIPGELAGAIAQAGDVALDAGARRLAGLTPQQQRVLAMVAEGRLNKQIADALGIQERTVKAHLTAIFERLGVRNRTQAGVLLRSLDPGDPARTVPD